MGPAGACKAEWQAAAQVSSPTLVILAMQTPSLTVGKATKLVECRARNCAEECGLVGR